MVTRETTVSRIASVSSAERAQTITAGLGFVSLYLAAELVVPNLAATPMPRPEESLADVQAWYADNRLAAATVGAALFDSAACLAWFVARFTRPAASHADGAARHAAAWGYAAVALLMVSSVLGWLLTAVSDDAQPYAVGAVRTVASVAGGGAHVMALSVFVLLASRMAGLARPMRVLAIAAAAPAVLSLVSLFTVGAAVVEAGRVLCMLWIVVAACVVRANTNGAW